MERGGDIAVPFSFGEFIFPVPIFVPQGEPFVPQGKLKVGPSTYFP
jgi:hypothetical protein